MPIDILSAAPAIELFTSNHLSDLKTLEAAIVAELVVCTQAWIFVSLQRYGHLTESHNLLLVNQYILECWNFPFTGVEHLGIVGAKEIAANKLFTHMKQLKLQLQEVNSLIREAQSMDVIW